MTHQQRGPAGYETPAGNATAASRERLACQSCGCSLEFETRFEDENFQCPKCLTVIQRGKTRNAIHPFDVGRVTADVLTASIISMLLIAATVLVLDALPTMVKAIQRGSFVILMAWLTSSFRRVLVTCMLSPAPGMLLALCLSPALHHHGPRWRRAFRLGFGYLGPATGVTVAAIRALLFFQATQRVPSYFLHGTMTLWLTGGYVSGTLAGVAWAMLRKNGSPKNSQGDQGSREEGPVEAK
jgi:predicted RNA-binding Zn-ribbon protein involved in translation (DUF1610 family)